MENGIMRTKIAVATVNGRAYYELVNELQGKRLPFLSLKPWNPVPLNIRVVLTTKEESSQISDSTFLVFEKGSNPQSVVDAALLIIQGKQKYQKIVVGVDPGKSCGIAILGDNRIIETLTTSHADSAARLIVNSLKRFPSETRLVRVGDGAPEFAKKLLRLLDARLPEDVLLEVIGEAGTSRISNRSVNRRVLRDAASAVKIAGRTGHILLRGHVA
jgi:hypothetical protein